MLARPKPSKNAMVLTAPPRGFGLCTPARGGGREQQAAQPPGAGDRAGLARRGAGGPAGRDARGLHFPASCQPRCTPETPHSSPHAPAAEGSCGGPVTMSPSRGAARLPRGPVLSLWHVGPGFPCTDGQAQSPGPSPLFSQAEMAVAPWGSRHIRQAHWAEMSTARDTGWSGRSPGARPRPGLAKPDAPATFRPDGTAGLHSLLPARSIRPGR